MTATLISYDGNVVFRDATLERKHINVDERTVEASLSSETPVKQLFGTEILEHNKNSINLERAVEGLPLLFNHNPNMPIGVVENVIVKGKKLRGTLRFSENENAREIWEDVKAGFLKNISIGYRIDEWSERDDSEEIRATKWTLFEASVVTVPADHSIGVNRSTKSEVITMTQESANTTPTEESGRGTIAQDFENVRKLGVVEGEAQARKQLQEVMQRANLLFASFVANAPTAARRQELNDLKSTLLARCTTYDEIQAELLDYLSRNAVNPQAGPGVVNTNYNQAEGSANSAESFGHRGTFDQVGETDLEKYRDITSKVLLSRVGMQRDKDAEKQARESEYYSYTPSELAREYLRRNGAKVNGKNKSQLIGEALSTRWVGVGTDHFANILADTANKSANIGYNEAPETWRAWCRVVPLPDFKQADLTALSAFSALAEIKEGGEYTQGKMQDKKETIQLVTYGKLFDISRQALINDDLSQLGRIPQSMGRAAARKVGDLPYSILTTNALMNEDGVALFSASHASGSNLVASGAAPSVTQIDTTRQLLAKMKDPSVEATLNTRAQFLICPIAVEVAARQIARASFDPATASGVNPNVLPEVLGSTFTVVADARLDAVSSVVWYMAASPSDIDTVHVAFLDGSDSPTVEQQEAWNSDGASFKVRIDAAAAAADFRGLAKNAGA